MNPSFALLEKMNPSFALLEEMEPPSFAFLEEKNAQSFPPRRNETQFALFEDINAQIPPRRDEPPDLSSRSVAKGSAVRSPGRKCLGQGASCTYHVAMPLTTVSPIGFIPTRNAEAARAFYEGVLGLRLESDDNFALVFRLGPAPGVMLRVVRAPEFTPCPSLSSAGRSTISRSPLMSSPPKVLASCATAS